MFGIFMGHVGIFMSHVQSTDSTGGVNVPKKKNINSWSPKICVLLSVMSVSKIVPSEQSETRRPPVQSPTPKMQKDSPCACKRIEEAACERKLLAA
jgi:hypothetical protein